MEWRASGLSARAYCEGRDFRAGTLYQWSHLLKCRALMAPVATEQKRRPVRFARVERTAAPRVASPPAGPSMTIELGGARVVVPAGFDTATVRVVLDSLVNGTTGGRR